MDCSMPGFAVYHQLLELTQTHVHWVGDAVQPFHPLLSPSPLAFNLSQHQGLFQWVSSSHDQSIGVSASASVLAMNIQDRFPLGWTGLISLEFLEILLKCSLWFCKSREWHEIMHLLHAPRTILWAARKWMVFHSSKENVVCGLYTSQADRRGGHGNPLQYSCLENPHGQTSLMGYSPLGHQDTTEWLSTAQHNR